MRLPGYAAEASLSTTRVFYRGVLNRSAAGVGTTVVAQLSPCDPCDICGDQGNGGGSQPLPPTPCPGSRHCCGTVIDGECVGECRRSDESCY